MAAFVLSSSGFKTFGLLRSHFQASVLSQSQLFPVVRSRAIKIEVLCQLKDLKHEVT